MGGSLTTASDGTLLRKRTSRLALYQPPREYPDATAKRFVVPVPLIPWTEAYADYVPVEFTAASVVGAIWADPTDPRELAAKFNEDDGRINRRSFVEAYRMDPRTGRPLVRPLVNGWMCVHVCVGGGAVCID